MSGTLRPIQPHERTEEYEVVTVTVKDIDGRVTGVEQRIVARRKAKADDDA